MNYFKDKKHIESQVVLDKIISYGRKSFTVCITCHYEHVVQIEKQVEFVITPFVMRKVPDGSRFFVSGQKDKSIKVTVLERGTGKQYPIN